MMFILELYDRKGKKLNMGDIVKVSDGRTFDFYCEVKYLEDEKIIAPFHTFSFHSFEKIDKVPDDAIKSTETRYNVWYKYQENAERDENPECGERYLLDWRKCEHLLQKRCFRIDVIKAEESKK